MYVARTTLRRRSRASPPYSAEDSKRMNEMAANITDTPKPAPNTSCGANDAAGSAAGTPSRATTAQFRASRTASSPTIIAATVRTPAPKSR